MGALGIVTVCYMLMAAALVMMVPVVDMETGASFAMAFQYVGLDWARYIVALGALMGIVTTTLVSITPCSDSRAVTVITRGCESYCTTAMESSM